MNAPANSPTVPASRPARPAGHVRPRRAWCRAWTAPVMVVRPVGLPRLLQGVELRHRDAELARVAAHLVQSDEPGVAVEGGVLDSLRHRRAAQLLHPAGQLVVGVVQPRRQRGRAFRATPGVARRPAAARRRAGRRRPADTSGRPRTPRPARRSRARRPGTSGARAATAYLGDEQPLDDHPLAGLDVLRDRPGVAGQSLVEHGQLGLGVDRSTSRPPTSRIASYPVVPATGQGGSSSPGSRIFSTVIQAPGASAASWSR